MVKQGSNHFLKRTLGLTFKAAQTNDLNFLIEKQVVFGSYLIVNPTTTLKVITLEMALKLMDSAFMNDNFN